MNLQIKATLNFVNNKQQIVPIVENGVFGKHIVRYEYLHPNKVTIYNARKVTNLVRHSFGFEVYKHKSKFSTFNNEEQVSKSFYAELIEMLHTYSNFVQVIPLNHRVRDFKKQTVRQKNDRPAFELIHTDYSPESALSVAKGKHGFIQADINSQAWQQALQKINLGHRWGLLNIWKPIEPVLYMPLAVCKIQTAEKNDIVKSILRRDDYDLEILTLKHNNQQQWFYFPQMIPDEWLIFDAFDSAVNKINNTVFHTAFNDNFQQENYTRKSIESRVLVIY